MVTFQPAKKVGAAVDDMIASTTDACRGREDEGREREREREREKDGGEGERRRYEEMSREECRRRERGKRSGLRLNNMGGLNE